MGFNWGGKKWRPANVPKGQPKINQSIDELLKPLSEKKWKGNVWGSEIMSTTKTPYSHKVSGRLTDKQLKAVQRAAKTNKMTVAEYIRACIL